MYFPPKRLYDLLIFVFFIVTSLYAFKANEKLCVIMFHRLLLYSAFYCNSKNFVLKTSMYNILMLLLLLLYEPNVIYIASCI